MGNKDFDDLLRKAIVRRSEGQMPDTITLRIRNKIRSRVRRSWIWGVGAPAAAVAIVFVIGSGVFRQAASSSRQGSAPAFFMEASVQTQKRLENSSAVSEQLRSSINNFYIESQ